MKNIHRASNFGVIVDNECVVRKSITYIYLRTVKFYRLTAGCFMWRLFRSKLRIQQLHMLLLLERHGSVHHVATLMGLTQPAITKSLKEVESLVGVPLFLRESGGLRCTPYCRPLLLASRDALLMLDGALAAIMELRGGISDRVSIGAVGGRALQLLVEVVALLNREHPELKIQLSSTRSDSIFAELSEGRLDIALSPAPADNTSRNRFSTLSLGTQAPLPSIVVRSKHPLAVCADIAAEAMLKYAWVLPPSPDPLRTSLDSALAGLALPQPRTIEASQQEVVSRLLECEDVIAVVDAHLAEMLLKQKAVCVLRHPLQLAPLPPLVLLGRAGGVQRPALRIISERIIARAA